MAPGALVHVSKDIGEIAAEYDRLDHAGRLRALKILTRSDQARMFEMCAGRSCTLASDFVTPDVPPLTEVIHWGYNSLWMFRSFQKRFCRPSAPGPEPTNIGYNEQAMKLFTGPGYFVAREAVPEGSTIKTVVIDYVLQPTEKPAAWPKILLPNSARLSRIIYFHTRDWMWKVSKHVTIGRARRLRRDGSEFWMDNWFVLCRQ